MVTIVLRNEKGSPLTNAEVDGNFSNLNIGKLEVVNLTIDDVTSDNVTIVNSAGSNVTIESASDSYAGLMSSSDKMKLDGLNGKTIIVSSSEPENPNIGDLWIELL